MKKILVLCLILVFALIILQVHDRAFASEPAPGKNSYTDCNLDKIEPDLWSLLSRQDVDDTAFQEKLADGGTPGTPTLLSIMVIYPKADYSHCLVLPTTDEVRICMWETLRTHADLVQAEARAYLDSLGIDYDIIYSTPIIWIDAEYVSRDLVCQLSKFDDVSLIAGDVYSQDIYKIVEIYPDTRSIKIEYCTFWVCDVPVLPVAEDALIHVPAVAGHSSFDDLRVGQEIYYTQDEDGYIDWIYVLLYP
jgi:hypothetical protein